MAGELDPGIPVFDENGALSRELLLSRGHCCESGCRNCPYGYRADALVTHPLRLVSLCPSNTEIAEALGLGPNLVGVDDWSDWPVELVETLPRLGPDLDIDLDAVESLAPDLVLASLSVPGMEKNVHGLEERGLPHVVLDPHSIDDLLLDIARVGAVTGTSSRAREVVDSLRQRIDQVGARIAPAATRPRLYWEWWPKPLFCPGERNWLTELSRMAGAENITAHHAGDAAQPTPEEIVALDPDYVLLAWTGVARDKVRTEVVRRRPGWESLKALKNDRLLVLEEGLYCRPSPRLIDGLEELARRLHPDCFEGHG